MKKNKITLQYERQLKYLNRKIGEWEKENEKYSLWRFLVFVAGIVATLIIFPYQRLVAISVFVLAIVTFIFLVRQHLKLRKKIEKYLQAKKLKEINLARINLDWEKIPETVINPDLKHPFENDLDLSGKYSLHRLIDLSVTREGSEVLRKWLSERQPQYAEVKKRQDLVRELTDLRVFSEKLLLEANLSIKSKAGKWETQKLQNWLAGDLQENKLRGVFRISQMLALFNLVMIASSFSGLTPSYWKYTLVANLFWFFLNDRYSKPLLIETINIELELERIKKLFGILEKFDFGHREKLKHFFHNFRSPENSPSFFLKKIKVLAGRAGIRMNPAIWLIFNALFPWDFYHALSLLNYKQKMKDIFPLWLNDWFETEALLALSNFGFINPEYNFPEITKETETIISAQKIGHPLLTMEKKVCNDFEFQAETGTMIITGSNMAGKSTFLRTLGLNIALAYAGAKVNADQLKIPILRLFSCIRVSDSVTDGLSYFYAEVKRLKKMLIELELNSPIPLFFLIDEIFKGTNNRERLIGSRALIMALSEKNCHGLVTTHDLELTALAEENLKIINYHFREDVIANKMVFDYKIRKGPCPTTNALRIMKIEGLPVDFTE